MKLEDQKAGEQRVQDLVIKPLLARGLTKPTTLTKAAFELMLSEMRGMLAYMGEDSLVQLREDISALPGGPNQDRFPILNKILVMASNVQPPKETGSPLVRSVLVHDVGKRALAEGYVVELIDEVKRLRRFPSAWAIKTVREAAESNVKRFKALKLHEGLNAADQAWFNRRVARIAELQTWRDEELGQAKCNEVVQ